MLGGKALAMQAQGPEFGFLAFMLKSQTWRCVPVIPGLSTGDKSGSGTCWAAQLISEFRCRERSCLKCRWRLTEEDIQCQPQASTRAHTAHTHTHTTDTHACTCVKRKKSTCNCWDPGIPLVCTQPKELKVVTEANTSTCVFLEAQLIHNRSQKQYNIQR